MERPEPPRVETPGPVSDPTLPYPRDFPDRLLGSGRPGPSWTKREEGGVWTCSFFKVWDRFFRERGRLSPSRDTLRPTTSSPTDRGVRTAWSPDPPQRPWDRRSDRHAAHWPPLLEGRDLEPRVDITVSYQGSVSCPTPSPPSRSHPTPRVCVMYRTLTPTAVPSHPQGRGHVPDPTPTSVPVPPYPQGRCCVRTLPTPGSCSSGLPKRVPGKCRR